MLAHRPRPLVQVKLSLTSELQWRRRARRVRVRASASTEQVLAQLVQPCLGHAAKAAGRPQPAAHAILVVGQWSWRPGGLAERPEPRPMGRLG